MPVITGTSISVNDKRIISFRWKRTPEGKLMERLGKNVLEFVAIQRQDTLEWALPGVCDYLVHPLSFPFMTLF